MTDAQKIAAVTLAVLTGAYVALEDKTVFDKASLYDKVHGRIEAKATLTAETVTAIKEGRVTVTPSPTTDKRAATPTQTLTPTGEKPK